MNMSYYGRYQSVRNNAWLCLLDFGIDSLPVDVLSIARQAGIRVIKNCDVGVLSPGESGIALFDGDSWFIVYDENLTTSMARYTLAHELGHIFLGHDLICDSEWGIRRFSKKPVSEQQADMFATRLLCPACILWGMNLRSAKDIELMCHIPPAIAQARAKRMTELYKRNMFLKSDLECRVYANFQNQIENMK